MAYEKHVWECDEDITDELLNHIEEGIEQASQGGGSDVFVIHVTTNYDMSYSPPRRVLTPQETYEDALEAWNSGKLVAFMIDGAYNDNYSGIMYHDNNILFHGRRLRANIATNQVKLISEEYSFSSYGFDYSKDEVTIPV